MKLWAGGWLLVVAIVLGAAQAHAGTRTVAPVVVSSGQRYAYGALGSARNAADAREDIGCTVQYTGSSGSAIVTCSAIDSAGVSESCSMPLLGPSFGNFMALASLSVTDNTYLFFTWDASHVCTDIETTEQSWYEMKALP